MRGQAILCAAALALAAGLAHAKGGITEHDVLMCNGTAGSSAEEQIATCTKVINSGKIKHPHESDFYAMRAAAYAAQGDNTKALADLNKALSYQQLPEVYFQRALVNIALESTDAAKTDLAQVMKLKPAFAPAHFMRGLIAYREADYPAAVGHFDEAAKRLPSYYQAVYARGVAKTKAGDAAGGAKDIKDARATSSHVEADMEKLDIRP